MRKVGIVKSIGVACFSCLLVTIKADPKQRREFTSQKYSWETQYATVKESGDLEWAPAPFKYEVGPSVRYIDFENGDDTSDGLSKSSAWKHHPWDKNATAKAKLCSGIQSYVFKRGVIYRGQLIAKGSGEKGNPIRLTSDPTWGSGEAKIYGSERVKNWKQGAHPNMPDSANVWYADLPYATRVVCIEGEQGEVTRLKLARTPNWNVTDQENYFKECYEWVSPKNWWKLDTAKLGNKKMHIAHDPKNLTKDEDYYKGALLWTEWGIVMGAPYATKVEKFNSKDKSIMFQGPWHGASGTMHPRNRYWFEDKPDFLDVEGEFWFDKKGNGGRLYVKFNQDIDPNSLTIEAAKYRTFIDTKSISNIDISGLTFKFGNVWWHLDARQFAGDVITAGIRISGGGENISIHHNKFEHLSSGIRVKVIKDSDSLKNVVIADNIITNTDHGGIEVADGNAWGKKQRPGRLLTLRILRNKLEDIGFRPYRPNGQVALAVFFADTCEIAGNFIERCAAAGIYVFGAKGSGATYDAPFARYLIHHNKVVDALLQANDWGAIETWQGGPFYVYNNVVDNPVGPMHWGQKRWAAAYYMDGSFKNYFFNNIGFGKANDLKDPFKACAAGFQNIHGFQSAIFNNSISRFKFGSNRQGAVAGRNKYLGNVFDDISEFVFKHGKSGVDPNAKDVGKEAEEFACDLNAYSSNIFSNITGKMGPFESSGGDYASVEEFSNALNKYKPFASDIGVMAKGSIYQDREKNDFRLVANSEAIDKGVAYFVPYSLYGTVGEWNFSVYPKDPTKVVDEHWYLNSNMNKREQYHHRAFYPLLGKGITESNYEAGELEDWTKSALKLNGKDQYLVMKHVARKSNQSDDKPVKKGSVTFSDKLFEVTHPAMLKPNSEFEMSVTLKKPLEGQTLAVDMNWLKSSGFGGWMAMVGRAKITGKGPYIFKGKAGDKPDLTTFLLTLYVSKTGRWNDKTQSASIRVSKDKPVEMVAPFNPNIDKHNFIVETYIKIAPNASGVVVSKGDNAGWSLKVLADGKLAFAAGTDKIASTTPMNDGKWHHILAEADRTNETLKIYIDGKHNVSGKGPDANISLFNSRDMYVGGTPNGQKLEATFDFLRIARGTLKDSYTTIDELYKWQFNGPFMKDFCGRYPVGKRDAGALEAVK